MNARGTDQKSAKVIFTSINPIPRLIELLKNLEIQAEWIPLVQSSAAGEDSFTFSTLKSTFDLAQVQETDLKNSPKLYSQVN